MKRLLFVLTYILSIGLTQAESNDSSYLKDPYFVKLLKTNSQVPIFYNDQVKRQIANYIRNLNNSTAILIGKTQYYNQLYNSNFETTGIPKQLFLSIAAYSNSDPLYIDQDGGSGMWALNYAIAKKYNLSTSSYVDERRNPAKSCAVAANYFKDLNLIYQDWLF